MRKPRKRTVVFALLLAGGATAAALWLWPRERPVMVIVARVERVPELKAVVSGTGEIRTEHKADIQAEIAGVIVELPVREGDRVHKDQVLLKIDPFQTQADVLQAKSALSALEAEAAGQAFQIASSEANEAQDQLLKKSAEVEHRQAETNLARARDTHSRDKKLFEASLIPPEQFEVTETQLKLKEAELEAAGFKIEQLEAQIRATRANIEYARSARQATLKRVEGAVTSLQRTEDLLEKTTIRARFDGVITKLNIKAGERAVPGVLTSPQATLMTIADFSVIEAELKVDETDIVNVKLGNVGTIVVDALPDAVLTGRVIEIGNSPIITASAMGGGPNPSSQEGKDFKVVLRLDSPPDSLRPGMSCEADITTDVQSDVLVIPIQALTAREVAVDADGRYIPEPPEDRSPRARGTVSAEVGGAADSRRRKELQGVLAYSQDRRARFRPVKTGIVGETDIEVREGLELGEEVIVGPLKALRTLEENARVAIDPTKPFRRFSSRKGAVEEEESGEKK